MRILVGGILQESNTFSDRPGTYEDFLRSLHLIGEAMLSTPVINNELGGFRHAAEEHGIELVPTLYMQSVAAGSFEPAGLELLKAMLLDKLNEAGSYDGILFALHGAWIAEGGVSADTEILSLLRKHAGPDIPIALTLDSHANVREDTVRLANIVVGYRTFPHIDFAEVGSRTAKLLVDMLGGRKLHTVLKKAPMIVAAERHTTYLAPMSLLWDEARAGEVAGDSVVSSLFAVQPWLDVPEMGFAVTVVSESAEQAERESQRLIDAVWARRAEFDIRLYSVQEVVGMLERQSKPGPIVISDSADSPGAGSSGDSNAVLRDLLAIGAEQRHRCLLSMVDPEAAKAAVQAGVGSEVTLQAGHAFSRSYGQPCAITGVVMYAGEGCFPFGGSTQQSYNVDMGQAAVIAIGRLSLLLMEYPTATGNPNMYSSVGLEPLEADLVLVKSAAQFRDEYEQLTDRIYILDTPGASTPNLNRLPFQRIPRPMYPFDKEDEG